MRNQPKGAVVYGIDLGKSVFHVVGLDAAGKPIQRAKFSRETLMQFFAVAAAARIGMEACPGAHWVARKLTALGHDVRIIPAQFVKPYVKSNKNDTVDAEAIAEALTRPTMRFVPIKRVDQIDLQARHRVRDQLVASRTALICQMRAFCLEYGIAMRTGAGAFRFDMQRVLADDTNDLSPSMRQLLQDLWSDLLVMETRIEKVSREIQAVADMDDVTRRLMSIPGIGPLGATALIAAVGDGKQFERGRDMAAWLGLVPAQYSTGGRTQLGAISRRGNPYVRRLLIHGARPCLIHMDRIKNRLGEWLSALQARLHHNKVVVALANKIARIAWVILTKPGATYQRIEPAAA
jgi:transposase